MEHEQIDQSDFIDLYLMGKLSAEESAGFEEHFVDCPRCLDRLQTTDHFLQGLRRVAAEAAPGQVRPRRAVRRFPPMFFHRPPAWALAGMLIVACAAAFFVAAYTRRLQTEVAQLKELSEQWQRRHDDEKQAALAADRKRQETELNLTEQRRVLEAKLKDEQEQRAKTEEELSRRMRPEGNLPILVLNVMRGSQPDASEAGNKIALPRSATMFVLSVPLAGEMPYVSYRLSIVDHRHRLIWKRVRATADRYNALSVGCKADFFPPGDYSLIVEGVEKQGGRSAVGSYPFQVVRTP